MAQVPPELLRGHEQPLGELGRLVERERGLSGGELARKEALGGLLAASRADGPDG